MKYSNNKVLLLCFFAMFVLASAHTVEQAPVTLWDYVMNIVSFTMDVFSNYVVAPILQVVKFVSDVVIAPITNGASKLGLNVAVDQFCKLVVSGAFKGLNDNALVLDKCKTAGLEEVMKGFDKKWIEGGVNA